MKGSAWTGELIEAEVRRLVPDATSVMVCRGVLTSPSTESAELVAVGVTPTAHVNIHYADDAGFYKGHSVSTVIDDDDR